MLARMYQNTGAAGGGQEAAGYAVCAQRRARNVCVQVAHSMDEVVHLATLGQFDYLQQHLAQGQGNGAR